MAKGTTERQKSLRVRDKRNGISTYRFRCHKNELAIFEALCVEMSMDKSELSATLLHEKAKALGVVVVHNLPAPKVIRIYNGGEAAGYLSELTEKLGISAKAVITSALKAYKESLPEQ